MWQRTRPAENYLQPNDSEIQQMAERVGLKTYSPTFVRDIANVMSGGEILSSAEYMEDLVDSLDIRTDKGGYFEYPSGYGHAYTTQRYDYALEQTKNYVLKKQENVCEFLRNIDIDKALGYTPLEKSCSLLKTLSESSKVDDGEVNGEPLPIFTERRGDKQAELINSINEYIRTLDKEEKELVDPEEEQEGGTGHGDSGLHRMSIASDMMRGRHHWINIARNLDSLTKFRVGRSDKTEPDIEGDDSRSRFIKGTNELGKMKPKDYALPESYRLYKAVSKTAQVRERVSHKGKKQLIYMIVDCSGSMSGNPAHKAGGVLLNRLKAVMKDKAEVYFRFFDSRLFQEEYVANDVDSAKELIKTFRKESMSGGGTNIDWCIRDAVDRIRVLIEQEILNETPELVVVTDGQDTVRMDPEDIIKHNIRLHAFMVEGKNKKLTNLARKTGGVGVDKLQ